jgi:hypothetical protein
VGIPRPWGESHVLYYRDKYNDDDDDDDDIIGLKPESKIKERMELIGYIQ